MNIRHNNLAISIRVQIRRWVNVMLIWGIGATVVFAEKHGLVIAIGDYPEAGMWMDISSKNDVIHVQEALVHLGFRNANILTLIDQDATQQGIRQAIQTLQSKIKPGDIVYIHFSGHGQQVVDDNADEIDQLDEAIVPYDSPMLFDKGVYEGERLIRDDEIGVWTQALRAKCGPRGQVILVLDSCHSGTGTRGFGKARGTTNIMADKDFVVSAAVTERSTQISNAEDDNWAPMVSFFGASPRELNFETIDMQGRAVGSLSYAITSTLVKMDKPYTFGELYQRIKMKMKATSPRQNPQWEGPANVLVLGGDVPARKEYVSVNAFIGSQKLTINAGTLSDIFPGTIVAIYTSDKSKVLARGKVVESNLAEATVLLDKDLAVDTEPYLEAKVEEKAYSPVQVIVDFDLSTSNPWTDTKVSIFDTDLIKESQGQADLYIRDEGNGKGISITTKDGTPLLHRATVPANLMIATKEIQDVIRAYMQASFLKSFESDNRSFDFTLELVLQDCNTKQSIKVLHDEETALAVGSCIQFKVTNNGIAGAYFSLVDIQPDNMINVITPATYLGYTAEEYYLKAGDTYITNYPIEIAQPLGQETIKLITSKKPLDLSGIVASEGNSTRGVANLDPFEKLFASTYNLQTRGAVVRRNEADEIGTVSLYFKIKE